MNQTSLYFLLGQGIYAVILTLFFSKNIILLHYSLERFGGIS